MVIVCLAVCPSAVITVAVIVFPTPGDKESEVDEIVKGTLTK
jgi:hypothetical protein